MSLHHSIIIKTWTSAYTLCSDAAMQVMLLGTIENLGNLASRTELFIIEGHSLPMSHIKNLIDKRQLHCETQHETWIVDRAEFHMLEFYLGVRYGQIVLYSTQSKFWDVSCFQRNAPSNTFSTWDSYLGTNLGRSSQPRHQINMAAHSTNRKQSSPRIILKISAKIRYPSLVTDRLWGHGCVSLSLL